MPAKTPTAFHEIGKVDKQIDVAVNYQIIGLFSEGLYSTPYKALEELVSNSFDADAKTVHVVVPGDLASGSSSIAVIDDGAGMDAEGLETHWIVGDSIKRMNRSTPAGRTTIGKFGIGKLAAYVLGDRLTHITRTSRGYYSTSMDFSAIPKTVNVEGGSTKEQKNVQLPLRKLTEAQARAAVAPWIDDSGSRTDMQLFGEGSSPSWTVAVISQLKPMAQEIKSGWLRWLLSTAMPLRDDFHLFLNSDVISSSKLTGKTVGSWTLGKDLKAIPKPAPSDLDPGKLDKAKKVSQPFERWYVTDSLLGPVSGYLEVFEDPIDTGKSENIGRSNGFFVQVNGRLINADDAGFGIDRNTLRHGTFSRFRFVVNIDRLDEELRSSRESLRSGPRLVRARELLRGVFNFARSKLEAHVAAEESGSQASRRLADSPASLSEKPILRLILAAFGDGGASTRHVSLTGADQFTSADEFRTHIEDRIKQKGALVSSVEYADLGVHQPLVVLQGVSGTLQINLEHPFVAHFADEFGNEKRNLPLQLFAVSEVLLEAHLYSSGVERQEIISVLDERDELLRHLAKSRGRQNSLTVASDLIESVNSKKELEDAVVAAFNQLGFDAVPKGGRDESDGTAEAPLAPSNGSAQRYRVSLEAKSKEKHGARVTKDGVGVSTVARHRNESNCDHAIVVGPKFQTGRKGTGAVLREIRADREQTSRTITLIEAEDLARLVRLAPIKRLNLTQVRELLESCESPEDCSAWIDKIAESEPEPARYRAILVTVWEEQQEDPDHPVEYGALRAALRLKRKIAFAQDDLRNECLALARMAPNQFYAREDVVELAIKPEKVLSLVRDYIDQERKVDA